VRNIIIEYVLRLLSRFELQRSITDVILAGQFNELAIHIRWQKTDIIAVRIPLYVDNLFG